MCALGGHRTHSPCRTFICAIAFFRSLPQSWHHSFWSSGISPSPGHRCCSRRRQVTYTMRAKRLRLNLKGQKVLGGYRRTEMLHFCHPESCYLAESRKKVMKKQSRAMIIHSFDTAAPCGHFLRLKASLLCWSQVGLDFSQGELSTFAARVRGNTIPIKVNLLTYVAKVIRDPLVPRMPRPRKGHAMIYDYKIQKTNAIS